MINFKQINNKQYQIEIINDDEKLDEVVTQTRGFILYLMEKNNLFPSLESLLKKENIFALNFILKNYDLDNTQRQKLYPYFANSASNKVTTPNLSIKEVEEQINENMLLSSSAILTPEMIKKHLKELIKKKNEENMDKVVKNSLLQLSAKEIFSLPHVFLKAYLNVFNTEDFSSFFEQDEFAQQYKKIALEDAKETGIKLNFEDFKFYCFKNKDKDLLDELLKNGKSSGGLDEYKDLKKIKGFSDFISPLDYFLYHNNSLLSLTLQEIEENKVIIQQKILSDMDSIEENVGYYKKLDALMYINSNIEQFEIIVDDFMFENLWKILPSVKIPSYYGTSVDKEFHILKKLSQFIERNNNKPEVIVKLLEEYNLSDFISVIKNCYYQKSKKEDCEKVLTVFYKIMFPAMIETNNYQNLKEVSALVDNYSIDIILNIIKLNPTTNGLLVLMRSIKRLKESFVNDKTINKIIVFLKEQIVFFNPKQIEILIKHYEVKINLNEILWQQNTHQFESQKDNLFHFSEMIKEDFTIKENSITQIFLLHISSEFRETIINKNIILEDYMVIELIKYPEMFWQYISQHEKKIKDNSKLLKQLLRKNEISLKLMQLLNISDNKSEENYRLILNNIECLNKLEKEFSYNKNDLLFQKENRKIQKENKEFYSSLLNEYIEEKINILIEENNYKEIESIFLCYGDKNNNPYFEKFYQKVEKMEFNELERNLLNDTFKNLFVYGCDYANTHQIKLPVFSELQNRTITNLLIDKFSSPENLFMLFPKESLSFVNQYVADYLPKKMYGNNPLTYNKSFGETSYQNSCIKFPYTNEQIIKAHCSLDIDFLLTNIKNVNDVLRHNFSNDEDQNDEVRFKEFLKLSESYPKLYISLADTEVFGNFCHQSKNLSYDQRLSEYAKNNINVNVVIKGINQIINEYKELQKKEENTYDFREKERTVFFDMLRHLILQSNYSNVIKNQKIYNSHFSDEQTQAFNDCLWKASPLLLLSYQQIGNCFSVAEELEHHFEHYMKVKEYSVEELLSPIQLGEATNYHPQPDEPDDEDANINTHGYIKGLINYLIKENKSEELEYLNYLIQQYQFVRNEIKYSERKYFQLSENQELLYYLSKNKALTDRINKTQYKFFLDNILQNKEDIRPSRKI